MGGPSDGASRGWMLVAALVPLALAACIYHPITGVFFFADDFVHLTEIVNEGPLVFLLRPFGGHAFLVRNLFFLGSWHLFGFDAAAFQWTMLLAHLLNVWLLFGVLRLLTASPPLACFGAAAWGASPLAAGSLAWYSIFGHVLVGTTLLVVLRGVASVATTGASVPTGAAATWFVLLLVGSTCYGPGIAIALVFPAVLLLLLPAARRQRGIALAFAALPVATLALYFGLRRAYGLVGELPIFETFHLKLARYTLVHVPALLLHFLASSAGGTLLGFLAPAEQAAATWIATAVFVAGVALVLWRGDAAARRTALAMLVLWIGIYGLVAAGRANVFALLGIPLGVAAATPRYHYAAAIPLVVLLCLMLQQLGRLPALRPIPAGPAVAAGLALLLWGHHRSGFRIDEHEPIRRWVSTTERELDAALASVPRGETLYLENGFTPRYVLGPMIPRYRVPGRAAVFLLTRPGGAVDGRQVRFIERDPQILLEHREPGTALGHLLVAPEEVPATARR